MLPPRPRPPPPPPVLTSAPPPWAKEDGTPREETAAAGPEGARGAATKEDCGVQRRQLITCQLCHHFPFTEQILSKFYYRPG